MNYKGFRSFIGKNAKSMWNVSPKIKGKENTLYLFKQMFEKWDIRYILYIEVKV